MNQFFLMTHNRWDKTIYIGGPSELSIGIDYDDVDRDMVDLEIQNLLKVLNEHWTPIEKPEWIQCETCDEQFSHFKKYSYTQCNDCIIKGKTK